MAWNPSFRLIRPDDQVVLDVRVTGIEPRKVTPPTPGGPTHRFEKVGTGPREIWLQFGPQQIIEYAKPEGAERADQEFPLFVPRADLVFTVPDTQIPFPGTIEGLLGVLRRSVLKTTIGDPEVAAVASVVSAARSTLDVHELVAAGSPFAPANLRGRAAAQRIADARDADAAASRPPPARAVTVAAPAAATHSAAPSAAPTSSSPLAAADPGSAPGPVGTQPSTSAVPMPRRLAVRPPRGPVRMSHPAAQPTHADRTELWATRLAVARTDPAAAPVEVEVDVALTLLPQGPLTGPRDENLIRNALFDVDTEDIGPKTQPPYTNANGTSTGRFPARVGRLMLSTLGGWLRLAGTWPSGSVRRLRVDTAQGRDQFQRLVVAGRLLPFGHRALLTSTTTRQFETGTTRVAGLQTRSVLQIVEPIVSIDPANGVHAGWPFATVELLHPDPIVGDQGFDPGANLSTFEVGGLPFQFQCRGIDRSGQPVDFQLTMLFARDPVNSAPDLAAEFTAWRTYTKIDQPPPPAGVPDTRRTSYFRSELGGQRLGVAVPPSADTLRAERAAAVPPISPTATTVLARRIELAIDATHKPVMKELLARVEALERFVPGAGEVAVSYAKPYLDSLLDGANAQGQVFLQFAKNTGSTLAQPLVGLAGQSTAGMAQVALPIAALSRRFGAVAGELKPDVPGVPPADQVAATTLKALSAGDLDLRFLTSSLGSLSSKLLGLVDLGKLVPLNPKPKLADSQQITTDVLNGVTRQTLVWNVPLLERIGNPPSVTVKPLRQGFIALEAAPPDPDLPPPDQARKFPPILTIVQETTAAVAPVEMRSTTTATITGLILRVYMSDDADDPDNVPIVSIPFKKISFVTKDGGKPDFDVVLGPIEFGGILQFVRILSDLIDKVGLSDPPALEVTSTGVRSSFSFDVPAVAIGMFALQNIGFSTALDLTFQPTETQPALVLTIGFARRANPFLLTVAFLGGGGYLEIAAASDGLARIEGSLQFGAALVINFAEIAKGSVEAMGGVIFVYDRPNKLTRLTAFLRIRGEVSVLSLISVSVTLELSLSYDFRTEILSGHAEVVVEVSVWFFSQSVSIPYDWEAKTGNDDPTFAELLAPAGVAGEAPWDAYCMAFAA